MHDVADLRTTIVPKSDQLNAEQLLGGPITVRVADVRVGSDDQPINVHYEGEDGRPYRPCKTMRKVLIFAWGPDGRDWIGKRLRLYNDPQVRFGGAEVGGIRISHMSDIAGDIKVSLTAAKGKKALHTISVLPPESRGLSADQIADWLAAIDGAADGAELEDAKLRALAAATEAKDRDAYRAFTAAAKRRQAHTEEAAQ